MVYHQKKLKISTILTKQTKINMDLEVLKTRKNSIQSQNDIQIKRIKYLNILKISKLIIFCLRRLPPSNFSKTVE